MNEKIACVSISNIDLVDLYRTCELSIQALRY